MALQDTLTRMPTKYESNLAPEVLSAVHRAADDLLRSGIMDRVLKVGDAAPEFSLPDQNGSMVRSSDLLRHGPLAIGFYRGVW
jgi:hypothetical protein